MKKKFRALLLAAAFSFAAYGAYAGNLTVSTYYPSPYGSYVGLDSSGQTHLATGAGVGVRIGNTANVTGGNRLQVDGTTLLSGNTSITGNATITGRTTTGSLELTGSPGGTGVLQASCTGGSCYAVYAP